MFVIYSPTYGTYFFGSHDAYIKQFSKYLSYATVFYSYEEAAECIKAIGYEGLVINALVED